MWGFKTIKYFQMKKCILIILFAINFIACKKQNEWLDIKSNKADVVPSSLTDLQAILDNDRIMNDNYPALGSVASDNYYVSYAKWQSVYFQGRNAYIWAKDVFEGFSNNDWDAEYQLVEYANIVLDGLSKIKPAAADSAEWNNIKGSALFYRAQAFYDLVQLFAKPYSDNSAGTDLGIPIRMTSDVNIVSTRSSLKETYDRILTDLKEAENLLPLNPLYKTRPSKMAADGLLARVYLNMNDYSSGLQYADKVLSNGSDLIDYNNISTIPLFTLPNYQKGNKEVIFYAQSLSYGIGSFPAIVDTLLYESYDTNDLRRSVFYTLRADGITFRGNYTGNGLTYSGISRNEIYLIRSECYARLNKIQEAMNDLNTLLLNRWKAGTFVPFTASTIEEALDLILNERRKELPFNANLRWQDLRRLNKDPNRAITLKRILDGQVYTLPPNDNRYVFPIPPDEIKLSGIEQNER
jgi:hypothetical protein